MSKLRSNNKEDLEKILEERGLKDKLVVCVNGDIERLFKLYESRDRNDNGQKVMSKIISLINISKLGYLKVTENSDSYIKYQREELYRIVFEHHYKDKYKKDITYTDVWNNQSLSKYRLAPKELVTYFESYKPASVNDKINELKERIEKYEERIKKLKFEIVELER